MFKRLGEHLLILCFVHVTLSSDGQRQGFSNRWVVEVPGGEATARTVAAQQGFTFDGPVESFDNSFFYTRDDLPSVSSEDSEHLTTSLNDLDEVKWAHQLSFARVRSRSLAPSRYEEEDNRVLGSYRIRGLDSGWSDAPSRQNDITKLGTFSTKPPEKYVKFPYNWLMKQPFGLVSRKHSAYRDAFLRDPLWEQQWYVQDYRTENVPVMDHNVVPVYQEKINGDGILIAVVDDGILPQNDFRANYIEELSYNAITKKAGAIPDNVESEPNPQGTWCAGVIAMLPNNKICGVGIAYGAAVTAIKVIGEGSTQEAEAQALKYQLGKIDIYSNSWNKFDDGKRLDPLIPLVQYSLMEGAFQGRGGLGAIYLFGAGSGKKNYDNCAADGYVNNPYTITIASTDQLGEVTPYSESCPAVMATAYSSSGYSDDENIVTVDVNGECYTDFGETAASVPIAAGIIALTLQANRKLKYRDVMHLITMSAEVAPVANQLKTWKRNLAGFWHSNNFGFGLLNAQNMVELAKAWKPVPPEHTCLHENIPLDKDIPYFSQGKPAELVIFSDGCQGMPYESIFFLEQVFVRIKAEYPYTGALHVILHAPSGTKTILMEPRPYDKGRNFDWTMKSVQNWGENPVGGWRVEVEAKKIGSKSSLHRMWEKIMKEFSTDDVNQGRLYYFSLELRGTYFKPLHYEGLTPRKYGGIEMPEAVADTLPRLLNMVDEDNELFDTE